jgi:hypothetical protein
MTVLPKASNLVWKGGIFHSDSELCEVSGPLQGGGAHKLNVLYATTRNGSARGKRLLESQLKWDFAADFEMTSVQFVAVHGLNYLALYHVEI